MWIENKIKTFVNLSAVHMLDIFFLSILLFFLLF